METAAEIWARHVKWLMGLSIAVMLMAAATAYLVYFREFHPVSGFDLREASRFTAILVRDEGADVILQKESVGLLNGNIALKRNDFNGEIRQWEGQGRVGDSLQTLRIIYDPHANTLSVELKEDARPTVQLVIADFEQRCAARRKVTRVR